MQSTTTKNNTSTCIFPFERKDRKGKVLFCFNPYPLQPIDGSIAIDGYLTEDDIPVLVKAWGVRTLKKIFRQTDRTISEDGALWDFWGTKHKGVKFGSVSLYDTWVKNKFIN